MIVALPVGDLECAVRIGQQVKLSLRTRDPRAAKARFAAAYAALQSFWEAQRLGPQPLTHKQRVALASEVRAPIVATFDSDPGDLAIWRDVQRVNDYIKTGTGVLPGHQSGDMADHR